MAMKLTRFLSIFLSAALLLGLFAGCGEQPQGESPMVGEVLVPGILKAGAIEKADGCAKAALADKI